MVFCHKSYRYCVQVMISELLGNTANTTHSVQVVISESLDNTINHIHSVQVMVSELLGNTINHIHSVQVMVSESLGNTIREGLEKLAEQLGDTAPAQRQAALLADLENSSGDYVPPVVTPAVQPPHPKATSESSKGKCVAWYFMPSTKTAI